MSSFIQGIQAKKVFLEKTKFKDRLQETKCISCLISFLGNIAFEISKKTTKFYRHGQTDFILYGVYCTYACLPSNKPTSSGYDIGFFFIAI